MYNYSLTLSSGLGWNIRGDGKSAGLADELARLMTLPQAVCESNLPDLLFCGSFPAYTDGWGALVGGRCVFRFDPASVGCAIRLASRLTGKDLYAALWDSLYPIYRSVLTAGGAPLHAALVERDGRGCLLAGAGGSGKSTACRLLPPEWRVLCDDETIVLMTDGKAVAHPFPTWSNFLLDKGGTRQWRVYESVPVAGIFFIEQAENDSLNLLGKGEGALKLYRAAEVVFPDYSDSPGQRAELFEVSGNISHNIPTYRLGISLKGRFWELLES